MTLLEQIEAGAVDGSCSLAQLLRQCHVLGARTGVDVLEEWVQHEADGYPTSVPIPDYRRVRMEVRGNFISARIRADNQVITPAELPEQAKKHYQTYDVRDSVAVIETIVAGNDDMITISAGNLAAVLEWRGLTCTRAWCAIDPSEYQAILNAVRNRVLRLATSLRKLHPGAGETQENGSALGQQIGQVVMTVIGGAVNVGGTNNTAISTNTVAAGDFEVLKRVLQGAGAPAEDIAALETAIAEDGEPKESGKFGMRVARWLGQAVAKIAQGGWKIAVDAGSSVVAAALKNYYGFK